MRNSTLVIGDMMVRTKNWKQIKPGMIITFLLLIPGCSGLMIKRPLTLDKITIAEIRRRIEQNYSGYQSLKARAEISVESPRLSFVATSNVIIKKPDSLLIRIKAPFGIGMGSFFIDRNQFLLYNSFQNYVYTGEPDSFISHPLLPIKLGLKNLIQAVSGIHLLDIHDQDSLAIDRKQYLIVGSEANKIMKYWIDPDRFVITEYQLLDSSATPIIKLEYRQFVKKNQVLLPKLIQMSQLEQKTRFTILYTDQKTNCQLNKQDFILKIPEAVNWIHLSGGNNK